jgi:hypothetical protein
MNFRNSYLDPKILIIEVETGDSCPVAARLTATNHGYCIRGISQLVAVIDGRLRDQIWCTPDHMLAIEAHECGHLLADTDDESTAEREAIRLLETAGHLAAAALLRARGVLVE